MQFQHIHFMISMFMTYSQKSSMMNIITFSPESSPKYCSLKWILAEVTLSP